MLDWTFTPIIQGSNDDDKNEAPSPHKGIKKMNYFIFEQLCCRNRGFPYGQPHPFVIVDK